VSSNEGQGGGRPPAVRIAVTIHHHLDPNSGAPGSTIALAEAYERAGHQTEILSFDDLPRSFNAQARMLSFPLLVASRMAGSLGRWADVLDSTTGDAWLWSLRQPPRPTRPLLVVRSHGLEHREHLEWLRDHQAGRRRLRKPYFIYHGGERLRQVAGSLKRAELAFFLNHDDREFSVTRLGVDLARTHLVRHGLDESFLGLPAPRPSAGSAGIRLALVARHTPGMGATYYAPALEQLLVRHPQLRVTLLGSGAAPSRVLQAFTADVRERIGVVPSYLRAELPELLQGHEILLSAKFVESYGLALVEAMACGLAPVAAAAAGPARIIEHEKTGLLVPPRDVAACVEAVERLIIDPKLRLELRTNAHAAVQQSSWDAVAAEQLALLTSMLARRPANRGPAQRGLRGRLTPFTRTRP
jgi:glycosyltransferase involved in cell wall biosynthesis